MALNIPLPEAPDKAFHNAIGQGANMYNMVIQQALKKAEDKREQELHPLKMQQLKQAMEHAAAASGRASQSRQEAHEKYLREKDPNYEINKFMNDMKVLGGDTSGQQTSAEENPQEAPQEAPQQAPEQAQEPLHVLKMMQSKMMPQGQGAMMAPEEPMPSPAQEQQMPPKEMEEPHPHVVEHLKQNGLDLHNLNDRQKMYMAKKGFKVPGESVLQGPARDAQDLEKLRNQ